MSEHRNNGWPDPDAILAAGPNDMAQEGYQETVRAMKLILAPAKVPELPAPGVSTLAYRRLSVKDLRAMQTPKEKRAVAYHEAGHAAMHFMFGTYYDIIHIDMQIKMLGTLVAAGAVVTDEPEEWGPVIGDLPHDFPSDLKSDFISLGKESMMVSLAGYSAEHRLCPSQYGNWLDEQLNMNGIDWNEDDPEDIHDMARAVRLAKALRGDNGNAGRLLRQMAAWTDEAFAHPQLWAVVVALAEQLVAIKTRMSGNRVCDIMDNAWNEEAAVPYLKMGPQWRRRFPWRFSCIGPD